MALINIFGLLLNEETGKVTFDDGAVPAVGGDFTFEVNGYNPLQYATDQTGEQVISILRAHLPRYLKFTLERTRGEGHLQPPPQLQVIVEANGIKRSYNAGLIANSLIRTASLWSFTEELRASGLLF